MTSTDPDQSTPGPRIYEMLYQAAQHHQAGRLHQAEPLYRAVLGIDPRNADANYNLGVLAMQTGAPPSTALPHFRCAYDIQPQHPQYWIGYVRALLATGAVDVARQVHEAGRSHGLQGPTVEFLLARMTADAAPPRRGAPTVADNGPSIPTRAEQAAVVDAFSRADFAKAEHLARAFAERFPAHGFGWKALGSVLSRLQRYEDALEPLERAAALAPEDPETHRSLAGVLQQLGLLERAEHALRQLLRLRPSDATIHTELGNVLAGQHRLAESEASFRNALAIAPGHAPTLLKLGIVLAEMRRGDEALACFRSVLEIEPQHMDATQRHASLLYRMGRLREAEDAWRQALGQRPAWPEALVHLGKALGDQGRIDEAESLFRQALALQPDCWFAHHNLLFMINYSAVHSTRERFDAARRFGAIASTRAQAPFTSWRCDPSRKRLRVGLVSGDLCEHPVGYFLDSILAELDPGQIELVAYATQNQEDNLSARMRRRFAAWYSLAELDDAAAAQRIHGDGIDILIDLAGHSANNRLPLFAWKPAPVQVSWLGYFATTGMAEIDFLLADETGVPSAARADFTETVWYLPDTRLCFTPPLTRLEVAGLPAIARGFVTFGCFQALPKLNDRVLETWARILDGLPGSRLRLQTRVFEQAAVRAAFTQRLESLGIDPQRVDIFGGTSREAYLSAYGDVDMVLDTFPYPGGTTTCEALWMGVPTLTLAGESLLARQGASLLTAAGLPDWVAENLDDYIARAIALSNDLPALAILRAGLRDRVSQSALFDARRFARNLEHALQAMRQRA